MIRILYGFFCDDIRVEVGGKVTTVGLLGGRVTAAEFPITSRSLGFHACVWNTDQARVRFELTIVGPIVPPANGGLPMTGELPTDLGKTGANLSVVFGPVRFANEGEVRATLRLTAEGEKPIEETFVLVVSGLPLADDRGDVEVAGDASDR